MKTEDEIKAELKRRIALHKESFDLDGEDYKIGDTNAVTMRAMQGWAHSALKSFADFMEIELEED